MTSHLLPGTPVKRSKWFWLDLSSTLVFFVVVFVAAMQQSPWYIALPTALGMVALALYINVANPKTRRIIAIASLALVVGTITFEVLLR